MIKMIQGELFRIRKNRLFKICLIVSTFFVFALALTFHYNTIKHSVAAVPKASLNDYTQFLYSDYSLILPITVFLGCYFTENSRTGTCSIFLSKGITRTSIFFGKEEMSFRICKKAIMKRNINNKNSKVDTIRLSPKKSKEERLLAETISAIVYVIWSANILIKLGRQQVKVFSENVFLKHRNINIIRKRKRDSRVVVVLIWWILQ